MEELFQSDHGRPAFATVLNNQRNVESGLQLESEAFSVMAKTISLFLDHSRTALLNGRKPNDRESMFASTVRPCKYVMIMAQSLVKKKKTVPFFRVQLILFPKKRDCFKMLWGNLPPPPPPHGSSKKIKTR